MKAAIFCSDPRLLREKARELVGDDEHAIRRLLELIVETNRTTLTSLSEHLQAARWEGVGSAAHRIAGSARMLGCDALIALLTDLEAAARAQNSELATALLPVLTDALASIDRSIAHALAFTRAAQ